MLHKWLKRITIGFIFTLSFLSLTIMGMAQNADAASDTPLPSPVNTGFMPIDDVQIYYATYGDPDHEPLILVHGSGGSADEFARQIPAFAEKYYVVAFDSRGRGRSTMGQEELSFPLLAADTLALMDYLEIDSAILVGWSDGGIIGLEIAVHHPERLRKLVTFGALYSPAGFTGECPTAQCDEYMGIAGSTYTRLSGNPEGLGAIFALTASLGDEPNFTADQLGSISFPVLVLDGLQDEMIYPEHTLELAQMIPTADLRFMNGSGHFAPWYEPEKFNHIVLDYLAQ